eukprot:jgi/Galph1/1461/GphlegSOOS_G147.1
MRTLQHLTQKHLSGAATEHQNVTKRKLQTTDLCLVPLLKTSPIDAADFEFRTHPCFFRLSKRSAVLVEAFSWRNLKLLSLKLPLTSATLLGQLETVFNTYPRSFQQVAFYTSNFHVSNICEAMQAFFQESSVTEYSLFVQGKDFSKYLILFLFYLERHPTCFLYIELDPFLSPETWNALLQRFQMLVSLK